ncbi:hypothetical protein LXM26_22750 [Dyadobacter sp. LJ419]|uniref:Ig-like domain-containing protein n=1 Tax=Dyadobacter chenwenxiniae TaxID=2906456 RepID=A0A9X1PQ44_9BACT|nr:hypothetical protein [Dyadobacter chenwenxiniae]MCF0064354.1 hypothetical protein [Dyadobacter chenwenxiniae]
MKRLIFYLLPIILLSAHFLKAQNASTAGVIPGKFPPTLWFNYADYEPGHTSNITHESGQSGGIGFNRPWFPALKPIPSGNNTFLSIFNQLGSPSQVAHKGAAAAFIKDLIPGRKYWLEYHMLSASMQYQGSDIPVTSYGTSGTLTLSNGASGTQTIPFDPLPPLDNVGSWVPGFIEFTATSTQATLVFTGTAGYEGGFTALDIGPTGIKLACNASGTSQVLLSSTTLAADCAGTVDLKNSYSGTPPPGTVVAWYYTPNHVKNTVVADPSHAMPGTYYAFYFDNSSNQCFNTDNSSAKVVVLPSPSKAGTQQVKLTDDYLNLGSCTNNPTVNLNSLLKDPIPVGVQVRWFNNPAHTGNHYSFVSQIKTPGIYYVFYYDSNANCYNTNNSTSKVAVSEQVVLRKNNASNQCPDKLVNLNNEYDSPIPSGSKLVWYTNPTHHGLAVSDPTQVTTGNYYAFFYNSANNCFNTDLSFAVIEVSIFLPCPCNAGTSEVTLKANSYNVDCPLTMDLATSVSTISPPNTTIQWFLDPKHTTSVPNPEAVGIGTYYAFIYDAVNKCYNTDNSTAQVTITGAACCNAGNEQVSLNRTNISNTCPSQTANLTKLIVSNKPQGSSIVWFTDASHTSAVPDPTKVGSGTYYAFFKDDALECFNTDVSTAKVTVAILLCETKVSLNLKVFLQGATTQENGVATMRNDLQVYKTGPSTFGLLPTQDPYGGDAVYPEIKNTFSKAGNVVDWVKVEIRSMQNPSIILESKSLLLRVDGTVLDVDGFAPKFNPQFGGVRIAVKHRNHLGVLGLGLVSFNAGTVNYDFSAELSKAYNVGATAQMVLSNGVWCMISGEIQQDFTIDNADFSTERISFNNGDFDTYKAEDLNLDGIVDNVDISFFKISFNKGYFSTLINY